MSSGGKLAGSLSLGVLCLALSLRVIAADRYFTWVDQNGQLRTTIIHEPDQPNPIEAQAAKHRQEEKATSKAAQGSPGKPSSQTLAPAPTSTPATSTTPVSTPTATEAPAKDRGAIPSKAEASGAGQAPSSVVPETSQHSTSAHPAPEEKSANAKEAVGASVTGAPQSKAPMGLHRGNAADNEYNLKNYPDGDTLAKHGFVRDKSHRPYFTWVDAENNLRSSFYQPPPFKERTLPKGRGSVDGVAFNRASVLSYRVAKPVDLPKDAAPGVSKVLGLNRPPQFLAAFSESCCDTLQKGDIADLPPDRDFLVKVEGSDPVFDFSSGKSHYRWVKLPGSRLPYALRVKSFIHNGVFVPTLVFFDSQFHITRLITDISFDYAPERWYRYGYLQATFPVYPGHGGDRWLLVMTRKRDLHQKTIVDHESGIPPIQHTPTGSLELAVVDKP